VDYGSELMLRGAHWENSEKASEKSPTEADIAGAVCFKYPDRHNGGRENYGVDTSNVTEVRDVIALLQRRDLFACKAWKVRPRKCVLCRGCCPTLKSPPIAREQNRRLLQRHHGKASHERGAGRVGQGLEAIARDVNFPRNDPKISLQNHWIRERMASAYSPLRPALCRAFIVLVNVAVPLYDAPGHARIGPGSTVRATSAWRQLYAKQQKSRAYLSANPSRTDAWTEQPNDRDGRRWRQGSWTLLIRQLHLRSYALERGFAAVCLEDAAWGSSELWFAGSFVIMIEQATTRQS